MDMEKIIKGLEDAQVMLAEAVDRGGEMAVMSAFNCLNNVTRAIAMLKEQDAVEPKQVDLYGKEDWYGLVCVCPDCKAEWMGGESETHFCPNCGKEVKWE